jgi:peptide/nickel transport system permease protein
MSALMTPRDTAAAPVRDDSGQDGVPSAAAPRLAGAWPRLRRHAPIAVPAALLVLLLVASLLAPWLPVDDPTQIELANKLLPPGAAHWFGTDALGRDIFAQVLHGARISLLIGVGVVLVAVLLGVPMGLVAGYAGGRIDSVLMRIADLFLAFPPLLLPILLVAMAGPGLENAMLAVAVSWFPWYARIARAAAMTVKAENYIVSARAFGASHLRIVWRHVLPNCSTPILVQASLDFGYAILTTASLGFIGLGATPPTPEWGLMISNARSVFLEYWWTAAFPGAAIFVAVMAANLLGDGLRDMLDPKHEGRSA